MRERDATPEAGSDISLFSGWGGIWDSPEGEGAGRSIWLYAFSFKNIYYNEVQQEISHGPKGVMSFTHWQLHPFWGNTRTLEDCILILEPGEGPTVTDHSANSALGAVQCVVVCPTGTSLPGPLSPVTGLSRFMSWVWEAVHRVAVWAWGRGKLSCCLCCLPHELHLEHTLTSLFL